MVFIEEIRKNRHLYLLALPGLIFLVVFAYIPMFGHLLAFKDFNYYKGIWGSNWTGFKNFKFFFMSDAWLRVTFNTIFLNALFIIFGTGIALILATFLHEISCAYFRKLAQSIIFLPYFISWLVVNLMVFTMLNSTDGLINRALVAIGFKPVSWYAFPSLWPVILTIINVWKFAGYTSIIFLAAMAGISPEYYETARIDGANRFQQLRFITLPLIRSVIIILTLLRVGKIFYGDFGMIYGLIGDNGTLFATTDVIDTFSYRALRQLGDFSMASAVILYQSVMGLVLILISNYIVRKVDPEAKLF